MILLDTSLLIDALCGPQRSAHLLRDAIVREEINLPTVVLYEWLRGPRIPQELAFQEEFFPAEDTMPFGPYAAQLSARMYRSVKRPRGREVDIMIAACAIVYEAQLWTLNPIDFADLPLRLYSPQP